MARAKTANKPAPKNEKKLEYYAEIQLAHGAGCETIYLPTKAKLDRFIQDVSTTNLQSYPLSIVDASGNLFVIRSFLFSKIIINES